MSGVRTLRGADEVLAAVGEELGVGDWHAVTQQTIDVFAENTGDLQWIHLDEERAKNGPFGATIAHGYLTLSLLPLLAKSTFDFAGFAMKVNYGLERVRFPVPVRSGERVRLRAKLLSAEASARGIQVIVENTIEIEGGAKPGCVAQTVSLLVPGAAGGAERGAEKENED